MGLISSIYSSPLTLASAERNRADQKRRAEKEAKRRAKLNAHRVRSGKKPKNKTRIHNEADQYGRPIYRPGMGKDFYKTAAWIHLRYKVMQRRGATCECCGAKKSDGVRIHVDHIRPRSRFPQLELVEENLQILCEPCNEGKGAWDQTDWRDRGGITHPGSPAIKAAHG